MGDVEFLTTQEFTIPVIQVVFYMVVSTACFFFKKYKLGLMVSYAFIFNWGFLHSVSTLEKMAGKLTLGLLVYLVSGLMLAVLVVWGFFREE